MPERQAGLWLALRGRIELLNVLPWLYWPAVILLVLGGLAELSEASEPATGIVAALLLVGTWGMVARAEDRR